MSDLISRQAAYETLSEYYHHRTEIQHKGLREALDRVPSAEPVRCKDCQHYDLFNNGTNGMCKKHIDAMAVFYPWDFCSYGERRTDG